MTIDASRCRRQLGFVSLGECRERIELRPGRHLILPFFVQLRTLKVTRSVTERGLGCLAAAQSHSFQLVQQTSQMGELPLETVTGL